MPRYIVELRDGDDRWLLEWSSVVDAPVSFGMTSEEFNAYYQEEYGKEGMRDLDQRLERVWKKGTSAHLYDSAEELVSFNRAGPNETSLSVEDIIEWYCRRKEEPR